MLNNAIGSSKVILAQLKVVLRSKFPSLEGGVTLSVGVSVHEIHCSPSPTSEMTAR
jgi:hypothetical protein